ADVSKYSLDAFLSQRDDDGKVMRDEDGNTIPDDDAIAGFVSSPEYDKHTDKNVALAKYAQRKGIEAAVVRQDREAKGTRGGLSPEELEDFIKTGETPASQNEGLETTLSSEAGQEQAGVLKHMERLAIS